MNRLGRDTQMCVHITKRQKYTEPNIRFSFPLGLHITGVQMSLLVLNEERGTCACVCMCVCLMLFCLHISWTVHGDIESNV